VTAPPAPRFLIDENLSPLLAEPARARGFEATHVNHLGLRTEADWELLRVVAEQDWVLVTNNAIEFRGRYREIELHPGVVFLLLSVRRRAQFELFGAANMALDVRFDGEGRPVVTHTTCLRTGGLNLLTFLGSE
jgi:predicted nuclease of predicted toxin-antitoxin system